MRRWLPHILAVVGSILLVYWATLLREVGAKVAARNFSIPYGLYFGALGLWLLAGCCLGFASIAASRIAFRPRWGLLLLYLIPGAALAASLPLARLSGALLPEPVWAWFLSMAARGGDSLGSLLIGFGLVQAAIESEPGADRHTPAG